MHDLPKRQRSLRAVFEYSWHLLTEKEQALFAQFSVFRGGFTREAAQHITGTNLLTLTAMINKSLLHRDNVTGRYDIHELLRQYAEEKLSELSDTGIIHDALAQYYMELLAQLTPRLKGYGQLHAFNLIEPDFENIRTAWNWAVHQRDAEAISRGMEGLYLFLTLRNRFMDGEQLFRTARQTWKADSGNPPLLAGQVLVRYPEQPPVERFRRVLAIAQQHDDPAEIAFCQRLLGHWLSHTEFNQDEGIPALEASLEGYQALGDKFYIAQVLDDLGWSWNLMMQPDKQRMLVQQSLDLRREIGDKIGTANSLRNMGGAAGGFMQITDTAFNYWQAAKVITYEMNDRLGIAWNASLQAADLIFKGDFGRVALLLDEAYPNAIDIGDPVVKSLVQLLNGILIALRDEDYLGARNLIEEAYPSDAGIDFRTLIAPFGIIIVACGQGNAQIIQSYKSLFLGGVPTSLQRIFSQFLLLYRLVVLVDEGQAIRATEFMRAFLDHTVSYIGGA